MTHPRRHSDEPPPEPDLAAAISAAADLRARAEERLAQVGQLIEAARDGLPLPEGVTADRLNLIGIGLRHLGGETDRYVRELERIRLGQVFGTAAEAYIRADERQQAAASHGRHRAAKSRKPGRGQLELIPGGRWKAPAVSGAAAMAAFRHAATAKGAAITTTAAAAAAVVTIGTSGFTTLPQISPAPAAAHAQAFAGLAPTQALPVMPMTPSPLRPYVPRHAKPSADAATATLAPPPPVEVVASPSSSVPSAAPQDPAYGTLNVGTITCAIGLSGTAYITFTAVGGPLQWHASSSSGLSLSSDGGIAGSGQSVSLTVSVSHGTPAGAGSVTIWAGGQQVVVPVTWVALPGLGL